MVSSIIEFLVAKSERVGTEPLLQLVNNNAQFYLRKIGHGFLVNAIGLLYTRD